MGLDNLKDKAQHLRRNMTDPERGLLVYLQKRQISGLKLRRQHFIGTYLVDFLKGFECYGF